MPRGKDGSIIGDATAVSTSSASGIWTMSEVHKYKTEGIWPSVGVELTGTLDAGGTPVSTQYTDGVLKNVLTYLTNGTLIVTQGGYIDFFLIAGGGGGGAGYGSSIGGSGGGAGGLIYRPAKLVAAGTYQIDIGIGGAVGTRSGTENANHSGAKGTDSTIDGAIDLTAKGGGGGGGGYSAASFADLLDGGCGGGDTVNTSRDEQGTASQPTQSGDSGTVDGVQYGFGFDGGETNHYNGAGGGGTAAAGGNTSANSSGGRGIGGAGRREGTNFNINGTNNYYGGGGGGGDSSSYSVVAEGGLGGGGNGALSTGTHATGPFANTGGGGGAGGATSSSGNPSAGGTGIVIIRYAA